MFRQHEVWRALCAHPAHSHREMDGTSLLTDTPRGFQRLHGLPISPRGADECASIDPLNLPFEPAACTWNPDEVVSRGRCVHCCAKSRHEQLHGILEGNGGVVADADTHGDGDADNENTTAGAPNGLTVSCAFLVVLRAHHCTNSGIYDAHERHTEADVRACRSQQ